VNNLFICADCGYRQCTVHNIPYHEGKTCQEFDAHRLANRPALTKGDEKSQKVVARSSVETPGLDDGHNVQKALPRDLPRTKTEPVAEKMDHAFSYKGLKRKHPEPKVIPSAKNESSRESTQEYKKARPSSHESVPTKTKPSKPSKFPVTYGPTYPLVRPAQPARRMPNALSHDSKLTLDLFGALEDDDEPYRTPTIPKFGTRASTMEGIGDDSDCPGQANSEDEVEWTLAGPVEKPGKQVYGRRR